MVLGRGHGKALRRAWDTYFWLLPLVFGISSYVYMTMRELGELSSHSSLVMKFMLFIKRMFWAQANSNTCDLSDLYLFTLQLGPGCNLPKMRKARYRITVRHSTLISKKPDRNKVSKQAPN